MFSGMTDLIERISAFLVPFQIYGRAKSLEVKLDVGLRSIICELLGGFVRICALSYRISERNKAVLYLGILSYGTDEGIQAELDALETLAQRETGMSVASILEQANVADRKISALGDGLKSIDGKTDGIIDVLERQEKREQSKEADGVMKRNKAIIKNALKIKDEEPWRMEQERHAGDRADDTGQWLLLVNPSSDWMTYADNIYCCHACLNGPGHVKSDQWCLDKLRNGTSENQACNPAHDFFLIPPWDAEEHAKIP